MVTGRVAGHARHAIGVTLALGALDLRRWWERGVRAPVRLVSGRRSGPADLGRPDLGRPDLRRCLVQPVVHEPGLAVERLLTGGRPFVCAFRQLSIGFGAAVVTYLLGLAFGTGAS